MNLSEMVDQDGRIEEAAALALEGAARAGALGNRAFKLLLEGEAATRLTILGRLDESDRLTEGALELPPSLGALHQRAARAQVALHRGRLTGAKRLVRAADEGHAARPGRNVDRAARQHTGRG
jgi:hypothetical protein